MTGPVAVVVGICPHGLAISRSLNRSGIRVVVLEANKSLAGTRSNAAEIVFVEDINGSGLIRSLVALAPSLSLTGTPILFLTNDRMIATVGRSYDELRGLYKLSWGPSNDAVLPLLRKEFIEQRCLETGILHPSSKIVAGKADLSPADLNLAFPVILKPDQPVSAYKTLVIHDEQELESSWPVIKQCLPAIAQEFIPGDESAIRFSALYLAKGDVVARFEGKKLRSRPMGHTSIAISEPNDSLHMLAREFFAGLDISGPVSLEVKYGPDGRPWVIEPTVGRTDFWVGLCIEDDVDFPRIEYDQMADKPQHVGRQRNRTLWINGERDPGAILWLLFKYPQLLLRMTITGVFVDRRDLRPFFAWCLYYSRQLPMRVIRKLQKVTRSAFSPRTR